MTNWAGYEGRCKMYCHDLSDRDWRHVCDCFEAERKLGSEPPPDGQDEDFDTTPPFD